MTSSAYGWPSTSTGGWCAGAHGAPRSHWRTGTYSVGEIAWVYRDGANHLLPERWEELVSALPVDERDDLVAAFHARVSSLDDAMRIPAALAWCR